MSPSKPQPLRYAVVGLGYIAQIAVLPAFAHAKRNSRLQALVSGDAEKLAELGERYGIDARYSYDDYERCLHDVDAVYLCAPNSEHADLAVRAAHAGVHVLCEKPLAVTDAECDRIITACREAGVKLMTAYRLHFEPLYLEAIDLVRRGEIGEPRYFSSSFSMHATPGGIRTNSETGGGTLYDLGVYCINAARVFLAAEPTQVFAYSIRGARSGMPEVDDTTSAIMRCQHDRLATFTTSFDAGGASSFRVVGTEGDLHVEPAYEYAEPLAYTLTKGDQTRKKKGRKRDQFAAEIIYFSDCIRHDRTPEPSGEEGAWEVRIVDALYESARRGEPMSLRPFEGEPAPRRTQAVSRPPVREPELVKVEKPHED